MFQWLKRTLVRRELRRRLRKAQFTLYPVGESAEEAGFFHDPVCVLIEDPHEARFKEAKPLEQIERITDGVGARYGLSPVCAGPLWIENAVSVAYCAFMPNPRATT